MLIIFSLTFFTCVHTWKTCLREEGRNVIIFYRICHHILGLVRYGRYCVVVSWINFIWRWKKIEDAVQRAGADSLRFITLWLGRRVKATEEGACSGSKALQEETYLVC